MNQGRKTSPIHKEINDKFEKLLKDPDYQAGIGKLDRAAVHEDFEALKERYATFINFYSHRRHMKAMKARRGELSTETEKSLVERGREALQAYRDVVVALERIDDRLSASGVGKALDRHATEVFQNFEHNPKMPVIVDEFRTMGVPEGAISWLLDKGRAAKFDFLRLEGLNGTFSGVVKHAASLAPRLDKAQQLIEKHGLPVIAGAGSDEDEYVEAGVVVGIAIIVGLIFGFCHDWRDTSLPHVLHWSA